MSNITGKKKKKTRLIILVLLGLVFLVSSGMLVLRLLDYRQGASVYSAAERIAGLPPASGLSQPEAAPEPGADPTPAEEAPAPILATLPESVDLAALRQVNPDVVGWLVIPGTVISYPLLQGEDNSYYLNHTFDLSSSAVGAIFMEAANSPDFTDDNTVIYGHRMRDGSMFAGLKNFRRQSYWQEHQRAYIFTDQGRDSYLIFAALEAEASLDNPIYRLSYPAQEDWDRLLAYVGSRSAVDSGFTPEQDQPIITLSTCTGQGYATRWVVLAAKE